MLFGATVRITGHCNISPIYRPTHNYNTASNTAKKYKKITPFLKQSICIFLFF